MHSVNISVFLIEFYASYGRIRLWVLPVTVGGYSPLFLYCRTACFDTTKLYIYFFKVYVSVEKGVVLVSDYELLMIVLTIVGLILIEKKQKK